MPAYYNEIDPYAAQWLRNLIDAGLIAAGDVDDRSIADVHPADLIGYDQCHFFAGLGGWPRALRLAGWPDDRPVWTGSCPCQPFSAAGKRKGFADERHLWPEWFRLIRQCRPAIVFGEQVASAAVWLDAVFADLEGEDYACGAAVLPAASVDAPHRRDRLWFTAHSLGGQLWEQPGRSGGARGAGSAQLGEHGASCDVANATSQRPPNWHAGALQGAAESRWPSIELERRCWWAVEPDVGRVAHGVPARVAKLRALGNAIVPQVAVEFILAAYPSPAIAVAR